MGDGEAIAQGILGALSGLSPDDRKRARLELSREAWGKVFAWVGSQGGATRRDFLDSESRICGLPYQVIDGLGSPFQLFVEPKPEPELGVVHALVVPTLAQLDELPPAEAEAWAREVIDALGDRRRMARLHADLATWLADRLEAG